MSASKRDELVQKALKAFYREGFHALGMDKLARETAVSKTAIYKHFRTKEDLILATLRLRDEQFRNWLMRQVKEHSSDPKGQLLAVFDALGEWFDEPDFKSCMFIKASSEYQDRTNPIHAAAAEHKRHLLLYFTDLTQKAGAANPDSLARELLVIKEGAIVLAHLFSPSEVARDARHAAARIINTEL